MFPPCLPLTSTTAAPAPSCLQQHSRLGSRQIPLRLWHLAQVCPLPSRSVLSTLIQPHWIGPAGPSVLCVSCWLCVSRRAEAAPEATPELVLWPPRAHEHPHDHTRTHSEHLICARDSLLSFHSPPVGPLMPCPSALAPTSLFQGLLRTRPCCPLVSSCPVSQGRGQATASAELPSGSENPCPLLDILISVNVPSEDRPSSCKGMEGKWLLPRPTSYDSVILTDSCCFMLMESGKDRKHGSAFCVCRGSAACV